jgi:hypothetical protein
MTALRVDKLSISFDPELGDVVHPAATPSGNGLWGWLAESGAPGYRLERS